jgi:hypothetical protein
MYFLKKRSSVSINAVYLRVDPWALRLYHPEALLYSLRRSRRLYSGAEGWYNLNAAFCIQHGEWTMYFLKKRSSVSINAVKKQTIYQIMLRDLKFLRYWWSCLTCSVNILLIRATLIENSINKKICVVHILGGISTIKQMKNWCENNNDKWF